MKNIEIELSDRDLDCLKAISGRRNMKIEHCAVGLIQQAMRSWEKQRSDDLKILDEVRFRLSQS